MSLDAMKQALEVLSLELPIGSHLELKSALRAAIKQAQKPVAWAYPEGLEALKSGNPWVVYGRDCNGAHPDGVDRIPLYLAPRQWQGLTDNEIALVCGECAASTHQTDDLSYARAIEAKLREKNS